MTRCTRLDLLCTAHLRQVDRQAVALAGQVGHGLALLAPLRPLHVPLPRAVARLARHVGFAPARRESIGAGVVALLEAGGVATDAHRVAGLVAARPVQHVAGRRLLVGQQVEPALALAVPRDLQRLQAPAGQRDQVLLQRRDAEGVAHLEVGQLAVGPVGAHDELVAALEEAGGDALMLERGVVEVAAHRLLGGRGHCLRVVRLLPLRRPWS